MTRLSNRLSLAESLNNSKPLPAWTVAVNAIAEEGDFWAAVDRHEKNLTELRFLLAVPNVLGIEDHIQEILKDIKEKEQAQEFDVAFRSQKRPLRPRTKRVEDLANYAEQGGGRAIVRTGRRVVYDSDHRIKKKHFDPAQGTTITDLVRQAVRWLRG